MPEEETKSRLEKYIERELDPPLPDIEGYEYILPLLESAGTILQTGMGAAPLTWQELESWERAYSKEIDCWELSFWELTAIKDMSYAYCAELGQAAKKGRQPPYQEMKIDRTELSNRILDIFMSVKNSK